MLRTARVVWMSEVEGLQFVRSMMRMITSII